MMKKFHVFLSYTGNNFAAENKCNSIAGLSINKVCWCLNNNTLVSTNLICYCRRVINRREQRNNFSQRSVVQDTAWNIANYNFATLSGATAAVSCDLPSYMTVAAAIFLR